ncbi:DNA cytosine methyltransferase, partial [Mycoplasmopsis bovis]|uniref:DNA cytosine methyltransferase n=1 Tax=Mycoplasmopsis bovis TaxID=28903 RepID=UPI003D280365
MKHNIIPKTIIKPIPEPIHNQKMTDAISFYFKNSNSIYQWRRKYVRENKNGVCPTLTANMGTGGHNVPLILTKKGIRKLTPRECFNFQGFPSSFK